MKVNLNKKVRVILTDSGVRAYTKYCKTWDMTHIDFRVRVREFHLWELMQIFGPYTYMGMNPHFEDNVMEVL